MREQQAQAGVVGAQGFEQHGGGARLAQRHRVYPHQLGSCLGSLGVVAKALFDGLAVAGLLQTAPRQFAA